MTARKSPYEVATDEKRRIGGRLREAREIAGLTLTEVSESLGYSQPVQLSLMETGQRPLTLRVAVHLAGLYGTTTDFLAGLTTDMDPDPATAVQRHIAARIVGEVRGLLGQVSAAGVDAVRELRPDAARTARLAAQVAQAAKTLSDIRAAWPAFDEDCPNGARLVAQLDVAAATAAEVAGATDRAQRVLAGRRPDFTWAAANDSELLAHKLGPLAPLHPGDDDFASDA